jgi:hypothetical protein
MPAKRKRKEASGGAASKSKSKHKAGETPVQITIRFPTDADLEKLCEKGVFSRGTEPEMKHLIEDIEVRA